MRGLIRRLLRRERRDAEPAAAPAEVPAARGLGEPSARLDGADEAELDTLRGELVRELDRLAADAGDSAAFRRG
ncbi:MAG TPA: hypothetical protein VF521_17290 [Pyrinomonadaceae bacterium]